MLPTSAPSAPASESAARPPRTVDERTRALVRLITGRRSPPDEEILSWLDWQMAFADKDASERAQALKAAEAIVEDAKTRSHTQTRSRLAREALRVSPECARAYILLANESPHPYQLEYDLYRLAVRAAERSLGREAMKNLMGRFGEAQEASAYIDARLGLAHVLWRMDYEKEALEHYRELLRYDTSDYAGVRYMVLYYSLSTQDTALTDELMARYGDDPSAEWRYSAALYAFRREGDSTAARDLLKRATVANHLVVLYLTGLLRLPVMRPYTFEEGTRQEAEAYAWDNGRLWHDTPGAIAWLQKQFKPR